MNKKELLTKIKKDDKCFVYDGFFNTCYNILNVLDGIITLDLSRMKEEDIIANESYNLKEYDVVIDDCTNKIEAVEFGAEFYKNGKKILAIEIY